MVETLRTNELPVAAALTDVATFLVNSTDGKTKRIGRNIVIPPVAANGLASIVEWGPITLVAGQQGYLLPSAAAAAEDVELILAGVQQPVQWTITDGLAVRRTLTITPNVSDSPTGDDWQAGLEIWGRIITGISSDAIGSKSIESRHLADGAIDLEGDAILSGVALHRLGCDATGRPQWQPSGRSESAETATTSGASVTVAGIADDADEVQIFFRSVSISDSGGAIGVQLGTSGGLETSGYVGLCTNASPSGTVAQPYGPSAYVALPEADASLFEGVVTLRRMTADEWSIESMLSNSVDAQMSGCGRISLADPLERIAVVVETAGEFDAGSIIVVCWKR